MKVLGLQFWALATAVFVAAAGSADAAIITWIASGAVTADTDVSLNGTSAGAVNVGGGAQVINGVTFVADTTAPAGNVTAGGTTFAMPYGNNVNANFWTPANPSGPSGAAYNAALDDARFNPPSGTDVTVTLSGLTNGQQYELQLWYVDTRGGLGTRTSTWTSTNAVTLDADGTPGPQWAIGSFTASGTTQTIVNGPQTIPPVVQLNMIQLRAVPEPGTFAMLLFGSVGLWLMGRKRLR